MNWVLNEAHPAHAISVLMSTCLCYFEVIFCAFELSVSDTLVRSLVICLCITYWRFWFLFLTTKHVHVALQIMLFNLQGRQDNSF